MPAAFAISRASPATIVGVILFAGSFARRRARLTATPIASPRRSASRTSPSTTIATVTSGGSRRSSGRADALGLRMHGHRSRVRLPERLDAGARDAASTIRVVVDTLAGTHD